MLNVKTSGIDAAIKKLESFEVKLPDLLKEVCERMMNEAHIVAADAFYNAAYPGDNDVDVPAPYWEDDRIVLRANGNAVAFIEFGTGKKYEDYPTDIPGDSVNPYSDLGLSARGTYGKGQGSNKNGWVYVGPAGEGGLGVPLQSKPGRVWTMGNPPARAMYKAAVKLTDRELAMQIAREVFNK